MGRPAAVRAGVVAMMVAVLIGACGTDRSAVRAVDASPKPTTMASATTPTVESSSTQPSSAPDSGAPSSQQPAGTLARAIDEVGDTGGAAKVITVVSSSWDSSTASLTLWQRGSGSWAQAGGPWDAHVGRAGWAYEPGEASGRSPVGSFTFGTGFGLEADPGYPGGWFGIGPTDYWVEDPASPDYNTHQRGPVDPAQAPWGHFEHLADFPVAYRYVALIDFNVPARGDIGSGIFLHVSTGEATAGCVSLPEDELLTTLRWVDPATTRIVMGPQSELPKL